MKFIVNKEKCMGCHVCINVCPQGMKASDDGTAEIIDSKKVEECGGESICPQEAIEQE